MIFADTSLYIGMSSLNINKIKVVEKRMIVLKEIILPVEIYNSICYRRVLYLARKINPISSILSSLLFQAQHNLIYSVYHWQHFKISASSRFEFSWIRNSGGNRWIEEGDKSLLRFSSQIEDSQIWEKLFVSSTCGILLIGNKLW